MRDVSLILNRSRSTAGKFIAAAFLMCALPGFSQDSTLVASINDTVKNIVSVTDTVPTIASRDTVTLQAPDTTGMKFYADEYNFIEFYSRTALQKFFDKWNDESTPKLTIAHFGDSHIQPGIFSSEVRKHMQQSKGDGGYGIVFPYSAARTYPPFDYKTNHFGKWQYSKALEPRPRLPLGVSGMTIRSIDPNAGFAITFRENIPSHYRRLKLFFKPGKQSFDFKVVTRNSEIMVPASTYDPHTPFAEIILPDSTNSIQVQLVKQHDEQLNFEFYGISLESEQNKGLVYHSLGVGGAPFTAVLEQVMIDEQLPVLDPDLVILDYGTNDFLYTDRISAQLGRQIVQTINWIRQLAPSASILLTSTQDMYRRGANIESAQLFAAMVRQIAREQDCGFYDWFRVSGGQYSMSKWVMARLARPDYIHLTKAGYQLKGKLFTQAFENTLQRYSTEPNLDSLVMEGTNGIRLDSALIANQIKVPEVITTQHRIRNGETLSQIADRYHVSVQSIMARNHLKNSMIVAGKYLIIEHRAVPRTAPATVASKPKETPIQLNDANVIRHKVVSGDTLGHIAEKYNVSVKDIKRLNGLHSSRIVEGKVLIIQVK